MAEPQPPLCFPAIPQAPARGFWLSPLKFEAPRGWQHTGSWPKIFGRGRRPLKGPHQRQVCLKAWSGSIALCGSRAEGPRLQAQAPAAPSSFVTAFLVLRMLAFVATHAGRHLFRFEALLITGLAMRCCHLTLASRKSTLSNVRESYPNSFLKAKCSYEESGPCPIMRKFVNSSLISQALLTQESMLLCA